MKLKGRTILVLCLLVFGGYALFDHLQDKKKAEKSMAEAQLMKLDFNKVDYVEIQKDGQKTILQRSADGWKVTAPIQDIADNQVADDFVKNTFPERVIDVAKEGDDIDWSLFGLDKPLGSVMFKTSGGEQTTFEVSEKKNFEDASFVRRDKENRVLVVNSIWQARVKKTAADFRDRHVLRHRIASVDTIKLKNSKGLLHLQRVDGQWQAPAQQDFELDQNKVREILTMIADAQASEIIEGHHNKPKGMKTLYTMELIMDGKSWTVEAGQGKDLVIFATISEPAFVLRMEPGALDKLITLTTNDLIEQPADSALPSAQPEQKEQK